MQKEGDPSVEDILRSIKQVISREDSVNPAASQIPTANLSRTFGRRDPFAANDPAPDVPSDNTGDEDVYDLGALPAEEATVEAAPDEAPPLPKAFAAPESEPASPVANTPRATNADDSLIAGAAAAAVRDQLSTLSNLSASAPPTAIPANPLEDIVREMLRPMLKEWLDANLQGLIERIVRDEIARITGRR